MIEESATWSKVIKLSCAGFFGNGHISILCLRARNRMCALEELEKSFEKGAKLIRANFHKMAPAIHRA